MYLENLPPKKNLKSSFSLPLPAYAPLRSGRPSFAEATVGKQGEAGGRGGMVFALPPADLPAEASAQAGFRRKINFLKALKLSTVFVDRGWGFVLY